MRVSYRETSYRRYTQWVMTLLAVVSLYQSGKGQPKTNGYVLSATLTGFPDSTRFYLYDLASSRVDSAQLVGQQVQFKGQVGEASVYQLRPAKGGGYCNLWLENKIIHLRGNKNALQESVISGSSLNAIAQTVEATHRDLDKRRDSLMATAMNAMQRRDTVVMKTLLKQVNSIDQAVTKTRVQTIIRLKPSIVTLKELYFLRNDLTQDSLRHLFQQFAPALQATRYGRVVQQYISTKELKIGDEFIDLMGETIHHQPGKLSDYTGQVVLLDFWASWCVPCRSSNRTLAQLYQAYHKDGFTIVSFSLDMDALAWQRATIADTITWPNLSDLKGNLSTQAARYRVRGIPKSFLINRQGKITRIYSGYSTDDNLMETVKTLLSQ